MYARTRRKKRTESMEATAGEREANEEEEDDDDDNHSQLLRNRQFAHQRDLSTTTTTNPPNSASLFTLAAPISDDRHQEFQRSSAIQIVHLLHESDLDDLIQLDWLGQIKFFLAERSHLFHQIDFIRHQFEKQYNSIKRRLEETENENERLITRHRTESKELLLYKNLLEAPEHSNNKDYQQLKLTIDAVLKENERLYAEIHEFKTSDPVYEQVQLLETANKHFKQELIQLTNQNNRLKNLINFDEIQQLKIRLKKSLEECEQLKAMNKKLVHQTTTSSQQIRLHHPSPATQQRSLPTTTENLSNLTVQNLRQFDLASQYSLPILTPSSDIAELKDQVHLLEQKLRQREYELQVLQIEIEKGTSSIMSSIEDLYIASSSVSPSIPMPKSQPTIEELQNELDQLHDKLDELTRENQTLKNRTQEFDTIYEENEYLYAEKSRWNEEIERARIRELVLEQEIQTLKEHEKEFLRCQDSTNEKTNNTTQLKLKIDWLHRTNNQLELEIVRQREQIDMLTKKCQENKRELLQKDEHYKKLMIVIEEKQQLPQELIRLEKLKIDLENQLEKNRQEHEKIVANFEEQTERREQKYSSLYDTILKLQNDFRQKELDYVQQMNDIIKQRDELHQQLNPIQNEYEQILQENKALKDEMKSKDEINRDLKLALTSSNNDAQTIYNQLRQLNTNLSDLQEKYERDLSERDQRIDVLQNERTQLIANYDGKLSKTNEMIVQLQEKNKQNFHEIETYRSTLDKLQIELEEKQNFIEQVQIDLTERSTVHLNLNNQLSQENKTRLNKITELEQALAQEQQRKNDLQTELLKSRAIAKESLEKSQELERRFVETDKNFEETIRTHLNETTEPTRRELNSLRSELVTKSDQVTQLQNTLDEERLKKQRLEMKLKRLKDEYITVRKELYTRIEENNTLQHELVECRFKNDYNLQITNQTFNTLKSPNETESTTAVQLYLKEKTENQHWQLKCRTYQQKYEQLQKNYEAAKQKSKQRLREERELFERTKAKYIDHIKNVQNDLHETRQLLEKDAELKFNQESAYQQLIDERRQLLTSMVDKDAKVREMRRENLLLTSKIQLLEDQMENLNDRVDRTLRERNQLRREINSVRFDSNVSIETSSRSTPSPSPTRGPTTVWTQPAVQHVESFGFNNGHHPTTSSS